MSRLHPAFCNVRTFIRMAIGATALLLASCTLLSAHGPSQAENKPIDPPQSGILHLDAPGATVSSPFFLRDRFYGIALSGGGSRAANFSAATMQNLDEFGLLRGADMISSVSGGGLAGAYYALNSPAMDWDVLRKKLNTDFLAMFLRRWAAPWHWPTAAFTDRTKTDVMADVFDEVLFSRKTYSDLPSNSPVFLANATDITAGGERAVFSNEYFLNTLGSSLVDIRIATAVATSAAFPGVFDSVTFQRFRPANIFEPRFGTSHWQPPSYVHLIDGGASDNLGAETLWDAALTELYGNAFKSMPDQLAGKPCVIISIDANAPNTSARFERIADERSGTDRIFNRNIFDAIDALFEHRRQDTLIKMGLAQKEFGIFASENFGDMSENYVDRTRVGTFDVPVNCRPESDAVRCHVDFSKPVPPVRRLSFQCFVWHIALDEVAGVGVKLEDSSTTEFVSGKYRRGGLVRLERLVTQTETNWKLSGPENCSSEQLQDGLYTAARVLVRDDEKSRFALCDYILRAGLIKDPTLCKKQFAPTDVELGVIAKNPSLVNFAAPVARTANLPVRCVVPQNPLPHTEH